MSEHPIEGLMLTAMNSIKDMIDVDTIIGDAIKINENTTIIPISKVTFGFAAGGSEFNGETLDEYTKRDKEEEIQYRLPFGGGSGAGVKICPIAFLSIQNNNVKLLPVDHSSALDKLLDYMPDLMEKANDMINRCVMKDKNNDEFIKKPIKKNKLKREEIKKNKDKIEKIGFDDMIENSDEIEEDESEDY